MQKCAESGKNTFKREMEDDRKPTQFMLIYFSSDSALVGEFIIFCLHKQICQRDIMLLKIIWKRLKYCFLYLKITRHGHVYFCVKSVPLKKNHGVKIQFAVVLESKMSFLIVKRSQYMSNIYCNGYHNVRKLNKLYSVRFKCFMNSESLGILIT